ncbi:MAG: RidA family protein [Anaerolineae bacterium]|nr:RidA family protein [Anaerolineae bacterium]
MLIERINAETLHRNPAYSQAIAVSNRAKLVFVGGQNAVDGDGQIVGKDIATQTAQTLDNVVTALRAAGATLDDVIKLTITIVQGHSLQEAFTASEHVRAMMGQPPTVHVVFVAGLAHPDFLIEVEAIAAIDEGREI